MQFGKRRQHVIKKYEKVFAEFRLDSPRSKEACKFVGIKPHSLLRRPESDFKAEYGKGHKEFALAWETQRKKNLMECVVARATLIFNVDQARLRGEWNLRARSSPKTDRSRRGLSHRSMSARSPSVADAVNMTKSPVLSAAKDRLKKSELHYQSALEKMLLLGLKGVLNEQQFREREEAKRLDLLSKQNEADKRLAAKRKAREEKRLDIMFRASQNQSEMQKRREGMMEAKEKGILHANLLKGACLAEQLSNQKKKKDERLAAQNKNKNLLEQKRQQDTIKKMMLQIEKERQLKERKMLEQKRKKERKDAVDRRRQGRRDAAIKRYQEKVQSASNDKSKWESHMAQKDVEKAQQMKEKAKQDLELKRHRDRVKYQAEQREAERIQNTNLKRRQLQERFEEKTLIIQTFRKVKAYKNQQQRAEKQEYIAQMKAQEKAQRESELAHKRAIREAKISEFSAAQELLSQKQQKLTNTFYTKRGLLLQAIEQIKDMELPLASLNLTILEQSGMPKDLAKQTLNILRGGAEGTVLGGSGETNVDIALSE